MVVEKSLEILAGWDASRVLALINGVGGSEIARKIASGDLKVRIVAPAEKSESQPEEPKVEKAEIVPVNKTLVDSHGRIIPPKLNGKVVDANRAYHLVQPAFDYSSVLADLHLHFGERFEFMSAEAFERQCEAIFESIKGNKQTKNLLNGVCLPLCFPKLTVADYGRTLEDDFLTAVARSYANAFPARVFYNWRKGKLADKVKVVEKTRHDRLITAMANGSVAGIYFPTALQGFSIEADREVIQTLPGNYLLAGALDASVAMVAFPKVLACNNTPVLDCAANSWGSGYLLYFRAFDSKLDFDFRDLDAGGNYSGGVLVLQ